MTTASENKVLTQTGPGSPMGGLMRQYWIPAAKSSELLADGDPVRLMLLGEKLIAFRDTGGNVGIMDHRCPHRCASLFFGRNEEGGIRCVYHGWKFDAEGNCLDMANVPPHQDFKHKVHAKAYRTHERNGLIWVYMGDQSAVPPVPDFEANRLPEEEVNIWFVLRECNWLQALEGDMDTSHLGFLHYGAVGGGDFTDGQPQRFTAGNRTPELHLTETDWGLMYAAVRDDPDEPAQVNMRISQFLMPFWTMPPINSIDHNFSTRAWVPVDDNHHMLVHISRKDCDPMARTILAGRVAGATLGFNYRPNSSDWLGRWRLEEDRGNDFKIDRERQRTATFTGIEGITVQDHAITGSMGEISDRTGEHLAPSDNAIIQTRKILVKAARDHQKNGRVPLSATNPEVISSVRGGFFMAAADADWQRLYPQRIAAAPFQIGGMVVAE